MCQKKNRLMRNVKVITSDNVRHNKLLGYNVFMQCVPFSYTAHIQAIVDAFHVSLSVSSSQASIFMYTVHSDGVIKHF